MTGPRAYYNEIEPYAAEWLRNLIAEGVIAPGDVDERDIRDVRPAELQDYTQCHFFAGIGVWSYSLRLAGWPDDEPVWTGSCPCQPFSAAGAGAGFADERHLWPFWYHHIRVRRPRVVFGEQVASGDGLGWLDLVQADLEGEDYACGPVDLCAAGVGAPHVRQRLFWVADADPCGSGRRPGSEAPGLQRTELAAQDHCHLGAVAHSEIVGCATGRAGGTPRRPTFKLVRHGDAFRLADHDRYRRLAAPLARCEPGQRDAEPCGILGDADLSGLQGRIVGRDGADQWSSGQAGLAGSFWSGAEWIWCRDGKHRPVEPGTFPLAHGAPARVGRLRAYGNAINAEAAAEVIRAYRQLAATRALRLGGGMAGAPALLAEPVPDFDLEYMLS